MNYHKLVFIDPLTLNLESLHEMHGIFESLLTNNGENYIIRIVDDATPPNSYSYKTFHDFFSATQPKLIKHLTIEARSTSRDDNRIEKSLSLLINQKMANISVLSNTDKNWVNNAEKVLNTFFKSRKTWFAGIRNAMAPVSNTTMAASLFVVSMDWTSQHYFFVILPILLVLFSFTLLTLTMRGKLFPYSRIQLKRESETQASCREKCLLGFWGALFIATAASLIHVLYFK